VLGFDKNPSLWTDWQCFVFGALLAGGRFFWAGEGDTGKYFRVDSRGSTPE
jgi:hypothetical protein